MSTADFLQDAWDSALKDGADYWLERLERLDVFDGVEFAYQAQPAHRRAAESLEDILRLHFRLETRPSVIDDSDRAFALLVHTIERLADRIRGAMERALDEDDLRPIPSEGVLQYFADDLAFCLYISYRAPNNNAFHVKDILPVPNPALFMDPVAVVAQARSNAELEVARKAMYSRHKTVLLRNTLVHVDREASPSTFGPTIDTLLISDWLLTNRFAHQRSDLHNAIYYQDPMGHSASDAIARTGQRILDVGTGSGMILATFAKNEAMLHSFDAVDPSLDAINAAYRNTYRQRQVQGGWIGDRGTYTVGKFAPERVTTPYDIVVCNPPYIPIPDGNHVEPDRFTDATLGTSLLELLLQSSRRVYDHGCMYLIISNTAKQTLHTHVPVGFVPSPVTSRTVPFQVESAHLDDRPDYVQYLKRLGLAIKRPRSGKPQYMHEVIVYSVRKAE